jgi:mRNA interferase MazF
VVTAYVPDAGDIVFIEFGPQVGPQQTKRRPALVLTDQRYNRASGLAVVCPLTSKRKPYPFALPLKVDQVEGAVLVDQLKSVDWAGRQAQFHSKAVRSPSGHQRSLLLPPSTETSHRRVPGNPGLGTTSTPLTGPWTKKPNEI